ncbi:Transposon Tf2-6 polyprotein [Labeo rohita]|uniref:ribonuclease H n=1 Tax=Labeo rohita TaxID=84645 RepID=A0ABQ8MEH9_LABRO|nr:Transposon Tf2-6 polyprotein [Labeo rohita]
MSSCAGMNRRRAEIQYLQFVPVSVLDYFIKAHFHYFLVPATPSHTSEPAELARCCFSGNPHRSSKIPCLGPGLPVHFLFVGHFTALRGLALREVLLVMLSILSVLSSDCLLVANRTVYRVCEPLLPAFYRPSRSPWIIPFDRRRPRPTAWTLTTRLDLPSPHLSAVVDPSLLFTSECLIKLLQMDPTPPDSSVTPLQKTSPPTDPATAGQIASEVSAQATMLTRHQQQLEHLTALTEQLVRAVQGLQVATPPAAPPPTASPPPAAPPVTASPRLAFPEKFDGTPGKCKGFLLQCTLFVNQQPHLYPTDEGRIAFVCSLLTGKALEWATAVWDLGQPTFPSFTAFLRSFKEVFQPSPESSEAGEQIMALRQGRRTAAEYALDFRTLAAQSGWNDGPLKLHYRKGLQPDLQVELACRDENLSLSQYIELSIRVDNVMRARKPSRAFTASPPFPSVPMASPEPMQLGVTKLSAEERERRLRNNLCLYCGQAGHIRATCPTRPPRPPASDLSIHTTALIDSGAAGNFIDADFVRTNHLPILSCVSPVAVAALDGRPLGTGRIEHTTGDLTLHTEPQHKETIRFFIITSPRTPLILGYPWLHQHEPTISWSEATITHWSSRCQPHSSQPAVQLTASPKPHSSRSIIPEEYQDLLEAFSTIKATHLPPHRAGDCAIDLVPGALPPRGRVFPLSQPESEAMNQYIQEELAKGFIRPSTSPASAGFFFVKKKDGGLRPCIDYRALNAITVKYRYPLPLVPPALEQLRTAKIYTKLDLRSAYNLIRIREGDEWKTAFSTTSGHYEYRVMPFGLANSPSYFQAFINEVFRDMLNRWVIVYIDDILIHSDSYSEHVQHVRAVLQRLVQHQLYAKQEKCEFHQQSISFLGYIISPEGVAMDESKVTAVRDWPRPKTLKELQRFLGFSNFYRRFIRSFSSVASPLTPMIKKGDTRLSWSPVAIQAFEELRRRFTTAPILHHPDPNRPFLVEVDASSTGVGAVLSQRQGLPPKTVPCAFYSHKLSPAERNYDVGNRELLAIKLALEEWRHWLEGASHPFTILTDHRNLEYLRSAKITYRPGSQNTKADALSRIHEPDHALTPPESILPPSVIVAPVAWDIMTEIAEGHTQDPPPNDCPENLTYVPLNLRTRVLSEVGIEATIQLLHNKYPLIELINMPLRHATSCWLTPRREPPTYLTNGSDRLPCPKRNPLVQGSIRFLSPEPPAVARPKPPEPAARSRTPAAAPCSSRPATVPRSNRPAAAPRSSQPASAPRSRPQASHMASHMCHKDSMDLAIRRGVDFSVLSPSSPLVSSSPPQPDCRPEPERPPEPAPPERPPEPAPPKPGPPVLSRADNTLISPKKIMSYPYELCASPWPPGLCTRPWLPELPDPPWPPGLCTQPWLPELPDPPWPPGLCTRPWLPELPDPPWLPELPDPPWLPELPDPQWLPEFPDPPWLPELPDPPWRHSFSPSGVCPARASRAPTPCGLLVNYVFIILCFSPTPPYINISPVPPLCLTLMNRLGWRNEQSRERASGRVLLRRVEEHAQLSDAVARTTTYSTETQKKQCKQTAANITQSQPKNP